MSEQHVAYPVQADRLAQLLRPRRIAVIGASDKSHFSRVAVGNLLEFGLAERVHLVNRRSRRAHGIATVPTVAAIGHEVDLALLMVPQRAIREALSEAAAAGVRSAVVLTSGYAETGSAGLAVQRELAALAAELGILLLGPNNLGFANFVDGVPVTAVPGLPRTAGSVALLSQSGASSGAMLDFAAAAGVELSYLVTLGNEAMITAGHVLDHLVDDEHTRAIAMFLETVREPEVFRRAARRARAAGKAVIVLKCGRSELAARTAAAHTGALVGDDAAASAVLRDLGVIRVDTIEDLLVTAGAATRLGRLARPGIGVVSISGGACDVLADCAADVGLRLPPPTEATARALGAVMPTYGTVQNPLDVTGAAVLDPGLFTAAITAMGADPQVGAVVVVTKVPWKSTDLPFAGQPFLDAIGRGVAACAVPVVLVNQVVAPITAATNAALDEAGIPFAICGIAQAASALGHLTWWSQLAEPLTGEVADPAIVPPPAATRCGTWSEGEALGMLAAAGIPVVPAVLARTSDEAVTAAGALVGPGRADSVAIKLASAGIAHKSDIGGVRLGVRGDEAVRSAFDLVTAAGRQVDGVRVDGALVTPMREAGVELFVGVLRDPQWGLLLAVALGGVFVEILQDSALAPLPVPAEQARRMLRSLRGASILDGARGRRAADVDALADVIERISALAMALGEHLASLEINPLHVDGAHIEALDAAVTWVPVGCGSAKDVG